MRLLVGGLLILAVASPAVAGDLGDSWLRGSTSFPADPPPYQRWNGLYGGGVASEDFHGIDFRSIVGNSLASIASMDGNFNFIPLRSFPQLAAVNSSGQSFGGFVGYNYQIDDVVLGFEVNFNASNFNSKLSDLESRSYFVNTNSVLYDTKFNVLTSASTAVADFATLRARFGWAYGNFLPYAFGGVSIAQIDTTRLINVNYCGQISPFTCANPPPNSIPPPPAPIGASYTQSDASHGKWVYGFDVGLGIDYALTRNIFVRGEVEYLQLGSPNDIKINTTSVRAGAGLKF
jgi:outer membrane immunogenic protein